MTHPLLFYDGDCGLCDRTVGFVLRHERAAEFRFVPFQSAAARDLLAPRGVQSDDLSSMLVLADGCLYRESAALVEILKRLKAPWGWLHILVVVPRRLRDAAYRYIGVRRYRWWGRSGERCAMTAPGTAERFLTKLSA